MACKEASGLTEIVAKRLYAKDLAGFVFDGLSGGTAFFAAPDDFDDLSDAKLDVQRMIWVIHEDAVPWDADGIRGRNVLWAGRQALCILQLARRTDRQWGKWVGRLRLSLLANRIPDVPSSKCEAQHAGHNSFSAGDKAALPHLLELRKLIYQAINSVASNCRYKL